jgi:DNA-binding response OmpR family regulator
LPIRPPSPINTCLKRREREVERLRRENAELRCELAEYRAQDAALCEPDHDQIAALVVAFKITRSQARIARALARSPGRVLSRDYLNELGRSDCESSSRADVHLSHLRHALIRAGIHQPFHNVHGVGWSMERATATKILERANAG